MSPSSPESPSSGSSTQRRITMCINELDRGGAEKALFRIAQGLRGRNWAVDVVSLRDAGVVGQELRAAGFEVRALGCGTIEDIRAIWRLRTALRDRHPDVLLCFLHQANIVGRIAGRWAGVPVVTSGIRVADRRRWVVWTDRITRFLVSHYVTVSRAVGEFHSRACRVPTDRWTAIPNGIDVNGIDVEKTEQNHAHSDDDRRDFRVLFVGRLTDQKRPLDLVDAAARLADQDAGSLRVDFVGAGPLRDQLIAAVRVHGLDNVHFHGEQSDVASWMARSDILVLPSAWEGMPNVVLEAMAAGLPVIATEVDGTPELIEHDVSGWLVASGDVDALAERIRWVMASPTECANVVQRARERVRQRFTWASVVDRYDALLTSLLDARPASR